MYYKQLLVLLYLTLNYNIVLCNHHFEETGQIINRSQIFWLIDNNSSYILPTDDKICNWGDYIEHCSPELEYSDKLVYRFLHINKIANHQTIYKFEEYFSADNVITEVRFVNVGRQRGYVKQFAVRRSKLDEDMVEAEIVVKANEQFRMLVEIYAYGSARRIFNSKALLLLISLLSAIQFLI